ncbi:MAG: hypothetical protein PHV74_00075 [Dehalococcoidia bacterium]|nr:hypothetical protein [Dehalococcoidia bacterium]
MPENLKIEITVDKEGHVNWTANVNELETVKWLEVVKLLALKDAGLLK